jgi:hypothetical protein
MKEKIIAITVDELNTLLSEINDAQKSLASDDFITSIGALAGAPDRLNRTLNRLIVLRDVENLKG